jgi:hypothetical protein
MGKRARAKKRHGGGAASRHRGRTTDPGGRSPASAAEGFALLAESLLRAQHQVADAFVDLLLTHHEAGEVATAVDRCLGSAVATAWEHGWEVADLVHHLGRSSPAPDRRLLVAEVRVAADAWRHLASADPDWLAQLATLDEEAAGTAASFSSWSAAERIHRAAGLVRAATLLSRLWTLPPLPPVGGPPSSWSRRRPAAGRSSGPVDERVAAKILALLAKAESTEFGPEAEALSAKAQELMTRYAIDHALLAGAGAGAGGAAGEQPVRRRVLIHDPYANGKSMLLSQVARANRCKSIWFAEAGFTTIVGWPTDLAMTTLLFTSLVTQCSTAMQAASRHVPNPRSFRSSFTQAFALRIGERLEEAAAATVAEESAARGIDLLPVLARRDAAVEEAFDEAFPHRRSSRTRISDEHGWRAGRAAADVATIAAGPAVRA